MRLGDLDALKKEFIKEFYTALGQGADSFDVIGTMTKVIDNAPTVDTFTFDDMKKGINVGYKAGRLTEKWERPQGEWIPVSERLPDDLEPVNITWINHEPEPYYKEIKGKPFTATGVYFNSQWYWWSTLCTDTLAEYSHNYDDIIDTAIEVIAWQPLPEPYKAGGKEE